MNAFVTALYRDVTCGAAATLITLVLGDELRRIHPGRPRHPRAGRQHGRDCRRTTPGSVSLNRPFW